MDTLDVIAIRNLIIIADLPRDMTEIRLVVEDNIIQNLEEPVTDYDMMFSLKGLNYPICFSFYRMFKITEACEDPIKRKNYLDIMDRSLDNLHYIINHTDDECNTWKSLKIIVDDIEDTYSELWEKNSKTSFCDRVQAYADKQLTSLVNMLRDSRQFLYLTPMTWDLWGEDYDDSDSSEESLQESISSDSSDSSDPDKED